VLNPDVAGPIKANGAIKHPDNVTPSTTITSNLLLIESPHLLFNIIHFKFKKKGEFKLFHTTQSCNYYFDINLF
jgi:hypothetical protein